MMAEKKQQKKKAKNYRPAKDKAARSPQKKAPRTGKSSQSPVKPSSSESNTLTEQDQQTDGLTELFKCIDQQLRKDAAVIAARVTKQIEKGFTIKQMVEWMKKAKDKPAGINGFEQLLSKMDQESDRSSAN